MNKPFFSSYFRLSLFSLHPLSFLSLSLISRISLSLSLVSAAVISQPGFLSAASSPAVQVFPAPISVYTLSGCCVLLFWC
ncbi:hypothetical protein LINGRAHAP2_LOCUS21988 [Linum grandiflorum]